MKRPKTDSLIIPALLFIAVFCFVYVNVTPIVQMTDQFTQGIKTLEKGKDYIINEIEVIKKVLQEILKYLPG